MSIFWCVQFASIQGCSRLGVKRNWEVHGPATLCILVAGSFWRVLRCYRAARTVGTGSSQSKIRPNANVIFNCCEEFCIQSHYILIGFVTYGQGDTTCLYRWCTNSTPPQNALLHMKEKWQHKSIYQFPNAYVKLLVETLTWPKKRKGRRKVSPRHIHDWKPSTGEDTHHHTMWRYS